jgi:hypothetical protein
LGQPNNFLARKDYTLRNILVTTKNKDDWVFHKKASLGKCTCTCFTMQSPLAHKPNLLCVKSYATIEMPPDELGTRQGETDRRFRGLT